ncbi:MAG TPA: response regulator [Sediminibacterium sp.]|nr:response regulator [Sediminibacterium sp.]
MNTDFLKGKRILIAEDDFVNQKLITHSLNTTGAVFDIAGNGLEAIELLKSGQYDLILMDINMPEMDGFEATQLIRKEISSSIPIIAMTGWSSRTEGDKFTQVGMNGCLAKPFGLDALYKTLDAILQTPSAPLSEPIVTATAASAGEEPLVDLDMLNELAVGDNEYKVTIMNMFLETMPETMQKMDDYLARSDWENFYKTAHYAKSSLSVVKVPEMHKLAQAMERNARQQTSLETIPGMLTIFKKYFEQAKTVLNKEISALS